MSPVLSVMCTILCHHTMKGIQPVVSCLTCFIVFRCMQLITYEQHLRNNDIFTEDGTFTGYPYIEWLCKNYGFRLTEPVKSN